jgi:hypothetical protein
MCWQPIFAHLNVLVVEHGVENGKQITKGFGCSRPFRPRVIVMRQIVPSDSFFVVNARRDLETAMQPPE